MIAGGPRTIAVFRTLARVLAPNVELIALVRGAIHILNAIIANRGCPGRRLTPVPPSTQTRIEARPAFPERRAVGVVFALALFLPAFLTSTIVVGGASVVRRKATAVEPEFPV